MNWHVDGKDSDLHGVDRILEHHLRPLFRLQQQSENEAMLRERYPALKAAWDDYQLALRLVSGEHFEDAE